MNFNLLFASIRYVSLIANDALSTENKIRGSTENNLIAGDEEALSKGKNNILSLSKVAVRQVFDVRLYR